MNTLIPNDVPVAALPRSARRTGLRARSPKRGAQGISLLEVLISMFILVVGLMSVASLFPVGGFYMARGERYDRGTTMAEQAFDDLRTRGLLRPEGWLYGDPTAGTETVLRTSSFALDRIAVIQPDFIDNDPDKPNSNQPGEFNIQNPEVGPGRAFVLDPLGAATATLQFNQYFPHSDVSGLTPVNNVAMPTQWLRDRTTPTGFGGLRPMPWGNQGGTVAEERWPIRRVTVSDANGPLNQFTAETVFRLRDDLAVDQSVEEDRPAVQLWDVDEQDQNDPTDDMPLTRAWRGSYSWLATIVPTSSNGVTAVQPSGNGYGSAFYEVSVAVIHGRDADPSPESERLMTAELDVVSRELALIDENATINGLEVSAPALEAAVEELRAGDWIAVAGVNENNGDFLLKWYKLLSLDEEASPDPHGHAVWRATLDGPDWPAPANPADPNSTVAENLRAIIIPSTVSVVTQILPMEDDSIWSTQ